MKSMEYKVKESVTQCHVCSVRVPRAYWRQHADSAAHRACAHIADLALDRARKQMSTELHNISGARAPSSDKTYFCTSCCCAVGVNKRLTHETSEKHRNSVLCEKMILSLSNLYKDRNSLIAVCKELQDAKKAVTNDVTKIFTDKSSDVLEADLDSSHANDLASNIDSNKRNYELEEDVTKPHASKQNDGDGADISEIHNNSNVEITCLICNIHLPKITEIINEHLISMGHLTNYKNLLKENHMENVNNEKVFCACCNKMEDIADELKHIRSRRHEKHCKILRDIEDSYKNSDPETYQIQNINTASAPNITTTDIQKQSDTGKPKGKMFYLFELSDNFVNSLSCKVCKVHFSMNDAPAHREDTYHREKYTRLLETNTMVKIHNKYVCVCCGDVNKKSEEYKHIISEEHESNLKNIDKTIIDTKLQELALAIFNKAQRKEEKSNVRKNNVVPDAKNQITETDFRKNLIYLICKDVNLPKHSRFFEEPESFQSQAKSVKPKKSTKKRKKGVQSNLGSSGKRKSYPSGLLYRPGKYTGRIRVKKAKPPPIVREHWSKKASNNPSTSFVPNLKHEEYKLMERILF